MNFNKFDKPFMVFGYCRISRIEMLSAEKYMRDNGGESNERIKTIDEQKKIIKDFAESKNWNDVRFFYEETSTPRLRRNFAREMNQFSLMFSECKENDVIIISSTDRVFGEVREADTIISKLKNFNIQLFIVDIEKNITEDASYKILKALLNALIKRQTISALRRRTFDNQMGSELSFRGGFDPIGFKSETREGKKVFIVNEEEKAILEEILEFKKHRDEEEKMRNNQKEKFESADPKKYTARRLEGLLIEKFNIHEKFTPEGKKRFSFLTIHRLLTTKNYVENKLNMIKRLEDLMKKDKS